MRNKFYYFENHGNEEGTDDFTIIYGDQEGEFGEGIITGAEDTEESAIESCKRLNEILKSYAEQCLREAAEKVKENHGTNPPSSQS